jgi:hypothetical protein
MDSVIYIVANEMSETSRAANKKREIKSTQKSKNHQRRISKIFMADKSSS